jgi:transcription-repair coupling factor (superfamily II helicase)
VPYKNTLPFIALAQMLAGIPQHKLIIAPDARSLRRFLHAWQLAVPKQKLLIFQDLEVLPYDRFPPAATVLSNRLGTLADITEANENTAILTTIAALLPKLPPKLFLAGQQIRLSVGQTVPWLKFRQQLIDFGYQAVSQVENPGEFAQRGTLLDFFPLGQPQPIRVEWFDDQIESLRFFEPISQTSQAPVQKIRLLANRLYPWDKDSLSHFRQQWFKTFGKAGIENPWFQQLQLARPTPGLEQYLPFFFTQPLASFKDYLPPLTQFFWLSDDNSFLKHQAEQLEQRYQSVQRLGQRPALPPQALYLDPPALTEIFPPTPWPESDSRLKTLLLPIVLPKEQRIEAAQRLMQDKALILACPSEGILETIQSELQRLSPQELSDFESIESSLKQGQRLLLLRADLEDGMETPTWRLIPEYLFHLQSRPPRQENKSVKIDIENILKNLADLAEGAPVVHEDHGVGRFRGLERLDVEGVLTEVLRIEYAGGDFLYLPIQELRQLHRYGGNPETAPWHKLSGELWQKQKHKAIGALHDVACELLNIAAERALRPGIAFPIDWPSYHAFCAAFPYELTEDQATAMQTILSDMQKNTPMDRLVCGDVGFGKTELAMRAIFVAVSAGFQVAFLAPTTILVQQHCESLQERFQNTPFRFACLSRLSSKKSTDHQEELLSGGVDILLGTHKILQKDLKFKNLGLIIIDEEQRFGVDAKEQLKKKAPQADILTLTATPIPRTLNFALSGLRELSIISTPPADRQAIETIRLTWDDGLIQEALLREWQRGGQSYFVHNDIDSLSLIQQKLKRLAPEIPSAIAHGQMPKNTLEKVMQDFYQQRLGLLISTTIVESGLNVPSANTMFIHHAENFGLAQLHQLRGRVGRSHQRAYCYLLTAPYDGLPKDAQRRLDAIARFTDPGMGFLLSTFDMEIRGSGAFLGDQQSGHINALGINYYSQLLDRTIKSLKKGETLRLEEDRSCRINLFIPSLLPEDYIADAHTRLLFYKQIAEANLETLVKIKINLIDRFGSLPEPADFLLRLHALEHHANALAIKKIDGNAQSIRFTFKEKLTFDPQILFKIIYAQPKDFRLQGQVLRYQPVIIKYSDTPSPLLKAEDRLCWLENFLAQLINEAKVA